MPGEFVRPEPEWTWLIVLYFFLGGIAAGSYFMGSLLELFGQPSDHPAVRITHWLAFPLLAVCGLLLIADLGRPERFFHMLVQSARPPLPALKWYSPMSLGSWALLIFSGVAFLSFLDAVFETTRDRFFLHRGVLGKIWAVIGLVLAAFFASYTGVLLGTTNLDIWGNSPLIGALFMASAVSTGLALTALLLFLRRRYSVGSREKLEEADRYAMGLELILIIAFVASLGALAAAYISSPAGAIWLWGGVVLVGLLVPLALHFFPRIFGSATHVVAPLLTLIGGLILRYVVVMVPQGLFH
jgi:formate-dependent nitrite reductase membrane component NrfD